MGITISTIESDPTPKRLVLALACDKANCTTAISITRDGYIPAMTELKRAGWSESNKRGRQFICPTCNGRAPATDLFT